MVIVLTDKQKQEVSFFKTLDPDVAAQLTQLSIEFLRKGSNPKMYNSAAKQLQVPASTIQSAVESMSFLIAESARQHVSPTDFIDTLHILQFTGSMADQLQEIYSTHKKEIRAYLAELSFSLPHYESLSWRLDIQDDDTNHHMDFILSMSNVRSIAYRIETCDRHKGKGIAGKIIPALITTTSVVAGFVVMELFKIVQGRPIDDFDNAYVNLSVPTFIFTNPDPAPKIVITPNWSITLWDNLYFTEPLTFREFIDRFDRERNIELTMITCESSLTYAFFQKKHIDTEVSRAYKSIKPDFQGSFINMSILGRHKETGQDVELPLVRYKVHC